ncbi:MAG: septum formation protein Maf [Paludibacteraceae bacterium]|nr:septum formation protein Maf [Paludibacteraceae bacterium]
MKKLLLGSASPRRKQLLEMLDVPFEVVHIDCDEHFPAHLKEEQIPMYLSRQKALAYKKLSDNDLLLTADTIVWIDGHMLGKPKDADEAKQMLRMLSGQTHIVYTGVTLRWRNPFVPKEGLRGRPHPKEMEQTKTIYDSTAVTFSELTDSQIDYYIENYRPFDKAGAYGCQDWIGATAISSIEGSFYNVMGLPVHLVAQELQARKMLIK